MKTIDIITSLSHYQPHTLAETTPYSAAVLVLIMQDTAGHLRLILTKRSNSVATYVGDYCFPGGMKEVDDPDLQFTAKRETQEELNIIPCLYHIIGSLDDFHDRYGNLVRPFIATITEQNFADHHQISTDEIAKLYYFPLNDLNKMAIDPRLEKIAQRHPSYSYTAGDVFIWGLTASIMVHLGNVIFNLNKPVAMTRISG
jgi:8-oxo-dGTP pyrophosphatase MutT (NUDIX family)